MSRILHSNISPSRRPSTSLLQLIASTASLLLVLAAGCGLESERPDDGSRRSFDLGEPVPQSIEYSDVFGSGGGSLGGNDAWFVIPTNALSTSTTITMSVSPAYSPGSLIEAEMGPDGQTFAVPCTLSIRKPSGYNPNDVYHIALWDEDNEEWDDLGGTDHGSYVSIAVSHFSKYIMVTELNE